jgi:hypothetical protein
MHYLGVEGMFAEPQARELVAVIRGVNESVLPVSMSLV